MLFLFKKVKKKKLYYRFSTINNINWKYIKWTRLALLELKIFFYLFTKNNKTTYRTHLIHSSFSSSVAADILYTVCFPTTNKIQRYSVTLIIVCMATCYKKKISLLNGNATRMEFNSFMGKMFFPTYPLNSLFIFY